MKRLATTAGLVAALAASAFMIGAPSAGAADSPPDTGTVVTESKASYTALLTGSVEEWNQWRASNPEVAPNMTRVNLSGENLSGANLSGVGLHRANMYGTNLSDADLSNTDLTGAFLYNADLSNADLTGADLSKATLTGANLSGADLEGAKMNKTILDCHGHTVCGSGNSNW